MKKALLLVLMGLFSKSYASHIVGGEFRMIHVNGFEFKIELIIYFDLVHGAPGAKDVSVTARIFRESDNAFIRDVFIPLNSESPLSYKQPSCSNGAIQFEELVYRTTIILQPDVFNDPEGYYIAWERCCRNYSITNVYSEAPSLPSSQAAGQAFYLQFPPIMMNDQLFINSSPQLKEPNADYTCVGYPYFADFSAEDPDGDSLVYSITTPWSTHTFDALPPAGSGPKPYPAVTWRPTFSLQNVMGENSTLDINSNGIISVLPPLPGLFSFAVTCEEFRNGVKIGEVRREFQITSLYCHTQTPPIISARTNGGIYNELPLDVHFDNTVNDEQRCVQVKVTDPDIINSPKEIRISAIPLSFDANVLNFLPSIVNATLTQEVPFAEFLICFDRCPPTIDKIFTMGIVAYDASCAVPLTDTVQIRITMDIPEGQCLHQKIVFPNIEDKNIVEGQFTLNATSTSGLPVTYSSSDNAIVTLSTSIATLLKPGWVAVTATQSGNTEHLPANPVKRNFCVEPQPPELSISTDGPSLVVESSSEVGNVWFKDGVFQTNQTGSSIPIVGGSNEHIYTARLLIDNCLSEESEPFIIAGLDNEAIQVFPNPVSHNLYVKLSGLKESHKRIKILGMMGQIVFDSELWDEVNSIDMSSWPTGIYTLTINETSKIIVRKIYKR